MNSELIELPLQNKKPAKLKTRKGGLGKSQGKSAKLKTPKGSLGKNKGIIKRKKKKNKNFWLYT